MYDYYPYHFFKLYYWFMRNVCLILLIFLSSGLNAENITFKDAEVESICVSKWDTDGDGKLSLDEAAAVTALGIAFKENKAIASFEELRFFTGLKRINDEEFYGSSLSSVIIPPNVMEIGESAFGATQLSGTVIVPGNVKLVNRNAFGSCYNIRRLIFEEGVEEIMNGAISGMLDYISLPSTITFLSAMWLNPYTSSDSSFDVSSQEFNLRVASKTPSRAATFAFVNLHGDGKLIVPFGSKELYKTTSPWKKFREIYEVGDVNEDGFVNIVDVVAVVNHILGKENARFNELIADVNGDGTINIADVIGIIDCILSD